MGWCTAMRHFNPRSHEGSDKYERLQDRDQRRFQSTLPRRERPKKVAEGTWTREFQSTLPRRERLDGIAGVDKWDGISIHAPTKGATEMGEKIPDQILISIHAPTKGATALVFYNYQHDRISIHAPTKGATLSRSPGRRGLSYFNPRSHEGSDRAGVEPSPACPDFNPRSHEGSDKEEAYILHQQAISIHAPTKGATAGKEIPGWKAVISIHAPTKGATG